MFIISRVSKSGGQEYLVPTTSLRYRWAKRSISEAKFFSRKQNAIKNAKKFKGKLKRV